MRPSSLIRLPAARWFLFGFTAVSVSACSSCGKKQQPPQPAIADAGPGAVVVVTDAGVQPWPPRPAQLSSAADQAVSSKVLPYGYPLTPDAPDWTWPISHVDESGGKKKLYVVGWAEKIANPSLASQVAQARARTNVLSALQQDHVDTSGMQLGGIAGVTFDKAFQSSTGAVFVEGVLELK